jgi:glycosyltransferase involved in cell wall biosynthesis
MTLLLPSKYPILTYMNKPPKILYLITLSEWGGAQKYVFDLAYNLKSSYDISVACGGDKNGRLFQKLTAAKIKNFHLPHLVRDVSPYHDLAAFLEIIKLIKKIKPDIVHLNSSKIGALGAIAAKLCGVKKIIYTVHGLVLNEPLSRPKKTFYWFSEWLSGFFKTHFICVSEYDKISLLKYHLAPAQKVSVIYNGIDFDNSDALDKKTSREKLAAYHVNQQDFLIGAIANLYPTKGLIYLIESAAKICKNFPFAKFIIIGEGRERKKLSQFIAYYQLENRVILAGEIPNAKNYLSAFDIFVLPSVKEGLAYTLIEALGAGLPIITTIVGGNPEIIINKTTGLLIPARNPELLAENIINLMGDESLRQRLGAAAKASAQKFSLAKMLTATQKIYNN